MQYPYNDEYMIYDYEEHRYILTPKAIIDKLGTDLNVILNKGKSTNPQNMPQMILNEISLTVYNEIYKYSNQNEIQEYLLAKMPSARKIIMSAMVEQVQYFLINGDLKSYAGVDVRKGTIMNDFSARILAPQSKEILSRPLRETGISVIYGGHYPILIKPNYEKEGY